MNPDSTDLEPELLRRFARQAMVSDGDAFVGRVGRELRRLQRARRWRRAVALLLAVGLLVSATPWVVSLSLTLGDWIGAALETPWTWVLSFPLGFWILRRSRAWAWV
jgi:uncharacterized protein (DUF2062 family)